MNPKITKLRTEFEKNKRKISDLQGRNRELEKQIRELEDTDIIGMVRENGMTMEQFAELFRRMQGAPARSLLNRRNRAMSKTKPRILLSLLAVILCISIFPVTAFASGGDYHDYELPPPESTEAEKTEEAETEYTGTVTTNGGNLNVRTGAGMGQQSIYPACQRHGGRSHRYRWRLDQDSSAGACRLCSWKIPDHQQHREEAD